MSTASPTRRSDKSRLRDELLSWVDYYSANYFSARQRFVAASSHLGLEQHALQINAPSPNGEPLTIDIAIAGASKPTSAVVVSSGVHGVEGIFGSAVQLALLDELPTWQLPEGAAVVFMHAINPFGFAWQRRFNEDNVDLNRNFLLADEQYTGAPPLAGAFREAMTPTQRRTRFGFWTARMALLALRHGTHSFWETLPVGQYDFPDWLFFGGGARTQSAHALDHFLPKILESSEETVHLDFHTGLGRWADGQLLLSESEGIENCTWWKKHFPAKHITQLQSFTRAFEIRGGFGPWLRALFPDSEYRYTTAEFGTYSPMRVIAALADELRWHAELGTESPEHPSRRRLADTFVPRSRSWRAKTLTTGLWMVRHAANALWQSVDFPRRVVSGFVSSI